jgi:hypothetical protein
MTLKRPAAVMAAIAALAITGAAASPPSLPPPKPLPAFQFKGVWAGAPADLRRFKCRRPRPDGMVDCKPRDPTIAGLPRTPIVMSFHRRLLSSMFLEVPWADFQTLETAFTEKYGPPSLVEHPRFQGALGPVVNTIDTWRFATGRLTLTQDVGDGEFAEAVYAEDTIPTPARPVVDF